MATPQIRPATEADLPEIAELDFTANHDHPVTLIPWEKSSDAPPLFLSHHQQYYWKLPSYHYSVATIDEKIVGFILWEEHIEPDVSTEEVPFPPFPEGTDITFFDYFVGQWMEASAPFDKKGLWEIENLAVSVEHRKKGIGALLVKHLTTILDEKKAGCFLRGSSMGKSLYEKNGWKALAEFESDFSKWNWKGGRYFSWYMQRDAAS